MGLYRASVSWSSILTAIFRAAFLTNCLTAFLTVCLSGSAWFAVVSIRRISSIFSCGTVGDGVASTSKFRSRVAGNSRSVIRASTDSTLTRVLRMNCFDPSIKTSSSGSYWPLYCRRSLSQRSSVSCLSDCARVNSPISSLPRVNSGFSTTRTSSPAI